MKRKTENSTKYENSRKITFFLASVIFIHFLNSNYRGFANFNYYCFIHFTHYSKNTKFLFSKNVNVAAGKVVGASQTGKESQKESLQEIDFSAMSYTQAKKIEMDTQVTNNRKFVL